MYDQAFKDNCKYCEGCKYYHMVSSGTCKYCNYIFVEHHKRPCPPGKGCTVREEREKWDGR